MRDIKFRAWDSRLAKMTYTPIIGNGRFYWGWEQLESDWSNLDEGKQYLMQYTGLKDKNGKEIYEGDIVYHSYYKETGKMIFDLSASAYRIEWLDGKTNEMYRVDQKSFEVIGNIYENPELLKEES